jgi:hypothetical protein
VTAFSAFYRYLMPLVRTVAEPAADNALRQAASDFCEQTNIWVSEFDPISVSAGVADYDLETDTGVAVSQILSVAFNGRVLQPKSVDELDAMYPTSYWPTLSGGPSAYVQITDDSIRLVPTPDTSVSSSLYIRAALFPDNSATSLPASLYSRYANEIAFGAASKLMLEEGREYYDPKMSAFFGQKFAAAIQMAANRSNRSRSRAPLRVQYVRL